MAKSPIANLRDSGARLRKEGERVAARIDKDVRTLAKRTRAEIQADVKAIQKTVRTRADEVIRDVEKRGVRVLAAVEKQVAGTVEEVLKRLHVVTQGDAAAVAERMHDLEARVTELERVIAEHQHPAASA